MTKLDSSLPTGDSGGGSQVPTTTQPKPEPKFKEVTAGPDDTLCTIAVDHGFSDCKKVRAANPEYEDRPVRPGEKVKVPEITPDNDSGNTKKTHNFKVKGRPKRRVWIIKDNDQSTPQQSAKDAQAELAVSNYVPTRQGSGFTDADWVDHTVTDYDQGASADPDHFKVLVLDPKAKKDGKDQVTVDLQVEKPVLNARDATQIDRWENVTDAESVNAKLENIVCKQVDNTAYYKSCYLRLVTDDEDHGLKRPWGRNDAVNGTVDSGTDVTKQTLVTPTVTDTRVEILDLRVRAERLHDGCPETNAQAKCRVMTTSNVGKQERVLRIKVYRVTGCGVSAADVDTLVKNLRLSLAQANVGVELLGQEEVPVPRNMITISDFDGLKGSGTPTTGDEAQAKAVVRARSASGTATEVKFTATVTVSAKDKPKDTAKRLAKEIERVSRTTAEPVTCRVSPNPPIIDSPHDFGCCDILCFRQDGSPVPLCVGKSTDTQQTIAVNRRPQNIVNGLRESPQYYAGKTRPARALLLKSVDIRQLLKNHPDAGDNCIRVFVIRRFQTASTNALALLPFSDVHSTIRPAPECRNAVLLSQVGAGQRLTLAHEFGHVLLDAYHTSKKNRLLDAELDFDLDPSGIGNFYDDNAHLGFSEWMAALNRSRTATIQIRKRMSDDPLNVVFQWPRSPRNRIGLRKLKSLSSKTGLMGGAGGASPTKRFRTKTKSVFRKLRRLKPPP